MLLNQSDILVNFMADPYKDLRRCDNCNKIKDSIFYDLEAIKCRDLGDHMVPNNLGGFTICEECCKHLYDVI